MSENNKAVLIALLEDLRKNLADINVSAWPKPSDIKTAVNTTFQVLEILITEVQHG